MNILSRLLYLLAFVFLPTWAKCSSGGLDDDIIKLQNQSVSTKDAERLDQLARQKYRIRIEQLSEHYITAAYAKMAKSGIQFDNVSDSVSHEDFQSRNVGTGGIVISRHLRQDRLVVIRNKMWGTEKIGFSPKGIDGLLTIDFTPRNGDIPLTKERTLDESCRIVMTPKLFGFGQETDVASCGDFISQAAINDIISAIKSAVLAAYKQVNR